jgi:hypothetical protein
MNKLKSIMVATLVVLGGCGGGGGGGDGSIPIPAAKAPTVAISLSAAKVAVNAPLTITWTSTDATSCVGSDALPVTQPINGSASVTQTAGGQFTYTIACTGAGGIATQSATVVVPMQVLPTSYENKNNIVLDNPKVPTIFEIPGVILESGEQGFSERPLGFADFAQEGAYSALVVSTLYKNVYPGSNPSKWSDSPGKLYFLHKDGKGVWQDITAQLIKDQSQRYVCVSPGFIEIADLNGDGKPDAMISCTGPDFKINGVWSDSSLQYVVLSQPDGSYKVSQLGIGSIYAHQVALADIDGDGKIDAVSVDTATNHTPVVLWGNGDGTFRLDVTRFPADMLNKSIYGIRAIPINGKLNVVVSGFPSSAFATLNTNGYGGYGTKVMQYGNGAFQYTQDLTAGIPSVTATGLSYGLALDAIYKGGFFYFLRVSGDYSSYAIVKSNAITGASSVLKEVVLTSTSGGTGGVLKLTSQDSFVSQMPNCGPSSQKATDWFHYECTFSVPLQ